MIRWLVSTSLRQPMMVLALAVALMLMGYHSIRRMPLDVFPEFAPPLIEIQTEAPGLSAEEVEQLVTVPIENALNGVPWLQKIRSNSVQGLSSVRLILDEGTDPIRARQMAQERLAVESSRLPTVAHAPVILSPLSSTSRVMKIGLSSELLSQMEMTDLAKWTIRPRLMAIPGVANVAIWGQRDRQYQVLVEPERLRASGVTLDDVIRAAGDATVLSSGGFIDTPNQRLSIRHISTVLSVEDLASTVVTYRDGAAVCLGDVAEIEIGFPPPIGDAIIDHGPGLLLIVEKQPWGNTLDVTVGVEKAMEAMLPALGGVKVDTTIFRPATFIERALNNLTRTMLIGCVLVVLVLVVFLYDWRTALISSVAIPLSLVAAVLVLRYFNVTMNTMILAGLVIALGEVVDDAIIDVENVVRRLRENRFLSVPKSPLRVILNASLEVRSAVVYASFIVMLVFMPVFFLEGLAGAFFKPLALAYVLAIFASMIVAMTVTPAMCMLLLTGERDSGRESPIVPLIRMPYHRILPFFSSRPAIVFPLLAITFLAPVALVPMMGEQFLPKFKETDFLMHFVEKPGTSLEAMQRISQRAAEELLSIPGVRNFGTHAGRAEAADEVVGPNFTELWISLDESVDYNASVAQIEEAIEGYPGLKRDVLTYLSERIKEVLSGASASIVVRLFGPDLETLRNKAAEIEKAIADVPGITNLKVEQQVLIPQIEIEFRPEIAQQFGLTPGAVRRAATTFMRGTKVGEIYHEQKVYDVAVWGTSATRKDIPSLRELLIGSPTEALVPLGDVADVRIAPTPNSVVREGASRKIDIMCNVQDGADLATVAKEIEKRVGEQSFDHGYHPEFLGEYASQQEARNRLFLLGVVAFLGICVLLYTVFHSMKMVFLVLLGLPFSLLGGIVGVWMSGGSISLGSLIGFVTVLGVSVRNGIMLISHYRHLEDNEGMAFGPALIQRGAEERILPILMTVLTAALGLLPLIWYGDLPGHEIEYPMAWVIIGGLTSSTVLNLFLMPGLYRVLGQRHPSAH